MNTQGKTDIPAPQAPAPHPGYAPHAALHAIKRHAVELMTQKEQVRRPWSAELLVEMFSCLKIGLPFLRAETLTGENHLKMSTEKFI